MSRLDVEEIDLAVLARSLEARVPVGARTGSLVGRTAFRDVVVDVLGCSELEAELIVDTLVARGFLVYCDPIWSVRARAS
jgi:hypothetical protein